MNAPCFIRAEGALGGKPAFFRVNRLQQTGQAALEALVSVLALAVLWVGVAWLGRIQDLALQASHASRYSAFMATRDETDTPVVRVRASSFEGSANQWSDRRSEALQNSMYQDISVSFTRGAPMAAHDQLGGAGGTMTQLRRDWHGADNGVLSAQVSLVPRIDSGQGNDDSSLLKLYQFDDAYPPIRRHTSIMTGSAHSSNDASAAERIANSDLAWSGPARNSYRLGRRVDAAASRVDAGWDRPRPVFDWLHPWADRLPEYHLRSLP